MRVLITGASGFVGRHLLPMLQRGLNQEYSELTCWSRAVHGDVLSAGDRSKVLKVLDPDAVIHLAWLKTGTHSYDRDPSNHLWAHETADFAKEVVARGSRFLGVGSAIENDLRIDSPYAIAKRYAGERVLAAGGSKSLCAWLRPSWIFDFLETRPRVLREAARSASVGTPFTPRNPQAQWDFIHVDDVASAIRWALDNHSHGRTDICSGQLTSVAALLRAYDSWRGGSSLGLADQSFYALPTPPSLRSPEGRDGLDWEPRQTAHILGRFWTKPDIQQAAP